MSMKIFNYKIKIWPVKFVFGVESVKILYDTLHVTEVINWIFYLPSKISYAPTFTFVFHVFICFIKKHEKVSITSKKI